MVTFTRIVIIDKRSYFPSIILYTSQHQMTYFNVFVCFEEEHILKKIICERIRSTCQGNLFSFSQLD